VRKLGWALAAIAALLGVAFLLLRTPDVLYADLKARYANAESEFVELRPGFTVHLRDEGPKDAPALLLIHGSNASLHTWEPWVARLSGRYRVISLDLQGHGLTGPDPAQCYTIACMAETVEAVRAKLGVPEMAVAGNSMGGAVATRYALAHPDRVAALVLVDAAGAPIEGIGPPPIGFRIARMPVIRDIAAYITPRSIVAETLENSVSVKSVASQAAATRYWELLRAPGNREATMRRFSATRTPFTAAEMQTLQGKPMLIIWGREDALIPVKAADWFKTVLPRARLVVYDRIGHLPQEEAPDRSAADVQAFLQQQWPAAKPDAEVPA
jgi:pimeloyl-ACP methyl ester carboxylesterase